MRLGQVLSRVRRDIQAHAARTFNRVQRMRKVVASARADLQERGGSILIETSMLSCVLILQRILHRTGDCLHEGSKVSHGQVGFAGVDHRGIIALVFQACTSCQSDVALLGHIIGMAGLRHEAGKIIRTLQGAAIGGIGQNIDDM